MRKAVLDTNLLVLLVVGSADDRWIGEHRRTRQYSSEDFHLLREVLDRFQAVVLTPHVLTETSNLLAYTEKPRQRQLMAILARLIQLAEERMVASRQVAASGAFSKLGLTDAVLLSELTEDTCVLTDDLDLYHALLARNRQTRNFTYIRSGAWPLDQV